MAYRVGNSNDIVVERLREAEDGTAITNAVLTATIEDQHQNIIASGIVLSHVSLGTYRAHTTTKITAGIEYKTTVVAATPYVYTRITYDFGIEAVE